MKSAIGQLHFGLMISATGFHAGSWRRPDSTAREDVMSLAAMERQARAAEAAQLDFVFLADGVSESIKAVRNPPLQSFEPLTLLSAIAARTERIGLVASLSTTFAEPYNAARLFSSLDHLSGGRAGWNVVTSRGGEDNFGYDEPLGHHWRYERAGEFLEVVTALWDSWSDDAIVVDRANGVYARPERVRPIHASGPQFRVAGPLNIPRSPQGWPVLVQAGSSTDGIELASQWAEVVFTAQTGAAPATEFRRELHRHAARHGRRPDQVKVLPGLVPILAETEAAAIRRRAELDDHIDFAAGRIALSRQLNDADLSGLDLDGPVPAGILPEVDHVERDKSRYAMFRAMALQRGQTLRDLIRAKVSSHGHLTLVGTPAQVADEIVRWGRAGAADGFVFLPANADADVELVTGPLVDELRRRHAVRECYATTTLREHLGLDRPPA